RLLQCLSQSRTVRSNAVHKSGGSLDATEEDLAARPKLGGPTLHIWYRTRRRLTFKRCNPQARSSIPVVSFHHDLLTVSGDIVVNGLKARRQRLGPSRIQVCYPYFAKISGCPKPWNFLYHPITELFSI